MAPEMSVSVPLVLRTHWWAKTVFVRPLSSEMSEVPVVRVSPTSGVPEMVG